MEANWAREQGGVRDEAKQHDASSCSAVYGTVGTSNTLAVQKLYCILLQVLSQLQLLHVARSTQGQLTSSSLIARPATRSLQPHRRQTPSRTLPSNLPPLQPPAPPWGTPWTVICVPVVSSSDLSPRARKGSHVVK